MHLRIEECTLTPSFDKLPIIAHFSIIVVESGNIALSHAPSRLSSSAKPYQKYNTHQQSISSYISD
jgi:hypothetical protein